MAPMPSIVEAEAPRRPPKNGALPSCFFLTKRPCPLHFARMADHLDSCFTGIENGVPNFMTFLSAFDPIRKCRAPGRCIPVTTPTTTTGRCSLNCPPADGVLLTGGDDINPIFTTKICHAPCAKRRHHARWRRRDLRELVLIDEIFANASRFDHLPRASIVEHRARRPVNRGHSPSVARRAEPPGMTKRMNLCMKCR